MSDAFKNYDTLLSSLNQANMEQRNANITLHQTKAGIDSGAKVLGEMKLFISGKPALEKLNKNLAKPLYEKYGKEFVDSKIESLKNKLGYRTKANPVGEDGPSGLNENAPTDSNKPPVEDAEETPEELNDRLLSEQGARESRIAREAQDAEEQSGRTDEVNDILARGAKRAELFEKRVASGDAEGEELIDPIKNMKNPFADNLEDYRNSNLTDFAQPKTTFTAEDVGAKGVNATYDRANGLTSEEAQTVVDHANAGINPSEINNAPTSEALNNSSGTFQNSVAQSRASVQPNVKADNQTSTGDDADLEESAEKSAGKTAGKTIAEETAETGAEEGGISILDGIPGIDLFGAIGGAILAGIMAHREKKQEEAEQDVATVSTNVDTQIGLSGTEALS